MPRRKKEVIAEGLALTPKRMEMLRFIRDYKASHGYSPTMQEIADEFGITKVTVFEHIGVLQEKGLVYRMRHKARSLELTEEVPFPESKSTALPLLGRIAAGHPIEAFEDKEMLDLDEVFASRRGTYALRVSGDSMIEDMINDGDYVIVEKRDQPYNGEVVVAMLDDGEVTLKRYYKEKKRIRLQPANGAYEPIYAREVDIQGVVIGVIRRY